MRRGTSASSGVLPSAKSTATPSHLPQELKPQLRTAASASQHTRTTRQHRLSLRPARTARKQATRPDTGPLQRSEQDQTGPHSRSLMR